MPNISASHAAPFTAPIEPAQRLPGAGAALNQSVIDDAAVTAVTAFDGDDVPGSQVAAGDLICGDFDDCRIDN